MSHYTEPARPAAKQSFHSDAALHRMNSILPPTPEQIEAAKNVVFREPDADRLGLMIFNEAL
jgi:hypothetical protein